MIRLVLLALLCSLSTPLLRAQSAIQCEPKLRAHIFYFDKPSRTTSTSDSLEWIEHDFISHYAFLPTVFFSDHSADIASNYYLFASSQDASEFSEEVEKWMRGAIWGQHNHVLNILGWRMQRHPKAEVLLTGRYETKVQQYMASRRASVVANYLSAIWGIDSKRIRTITKEVDATETGCGNSCRVDIASESWELMRPVTTHDITHFPNPDFMEFHIADGCDSAQVADRWLLLTIDSALVLTCTPEHGLTADKSGTIWTWGIGTTPMDRWPQRSVDAQLVVRTADSVTHTSPALHFSMKHIMQEQVVFGCFDKAYRAPALLFSSKTDTELTSQHRRCIEEYALAYSEGCRAIHITGYTDTGGEEDVNLNISRQRAESVAKEIRAHLHNSEIDVKVQSVGSEEGRYSNDYPQGRLLNRGVDIMFLYSADHSEVIVK